MDIENSSEYQEYKLKVDQASSLRISLDKMEKDQIPALKKSLDRFCKNAGHGYGEEKISKEWKSRMVKEISYCGQDNSVDAGHEVVFFTKKCRYCGHVSKRKADTTYS